MHDKYGQIYNVYDNFGLLSCNFDIKTSFLMLENHENDQNSKHVQENGQAYVSETVNL